MLIEDYFGLKGIMNADEVSRLLWEGPMVNSIQISLDRNRLGVLYDAIKRLPTVGGMALQRASLANFREFRRYSLPPWPASTRALPPSSHLGLSITTRAYRFRKRVCELASLRVLGFTRAEVFRILLLELALLALLAQPVGWGNRLWSRLDYAKQSCWRADARASWSNPRPTSSPAELS